MGKLFKILFNIMLVLIIIVLIAYFVLRYTNTIQIYNVETGSMEDKIHTGDYILLYKTDKYNVGDVVTYKVDNYFITHRIIKISDGKITTKGDANNLIDAEANLDQIQGKAIYWGGVLNFVINYKFVIVIFLVGLYLLSCYFSEDKEEIKDDSDINNDDEKDKKEEIKEEKQSDEILIEEIGDTPQEIVIEEIEEKAEIKTIEDTELEEIKPKKKTTRKKSSSTEEIEKEEKVEDKKPSENKKTTTKKTENKEKKTSKNTKKTSSKTKK